MEHLDVITRREVGIDPNTCRRFIEVPAAQARTLWDYRSRGFTIGAARVHIETLLARHLSWPRAVRNRVGSVPKCISDRLIAYHKSAQERKERRKAAAAIELAKTACDPDDMLRGYGHGYACRIDCQDGITLTLERIEEVDWGRRYKPGRWPESTKITYRARLYSRRFDLLKECTFSRRGKWLQAIAHIWSLKLDLMSKTKLQKMLTVGRYDASLPGQKVVMIAAPWIVVRLTTCQAAQLISIGTIWCTKQQNHAKTYVSQGLYVIYRDGIRYALYCPATRESRDGRNEDVPLPDAVRQAV